VQTTDVTIGVPVRDLAAARRWYETLLEVEAPDLEPVDGVVEYRVGSCWLQLSEDHSGPGGWVFRIGVPDVRAERRRLLELGLDVGDLVEIDTVIAFCDFRDPDGNTLSIYTVSASQADVAAAPQVATGPLG
jgi:catechol 2,3-dioxygenase-like lactoylglutathione lyase family enzyme